MAKIKLTKREYIGEGFWHYFRNDETGEVVREECTKEEYLRLGQKDGYKFNPVKTGFTWFQSAGGTVDVDTPDKMLGINEYTIVGEDAFIRFGISGIYKIRKKSEIVNDEIEK